MFCTVHQCFTILYCVLECTDTSVMYSSSHCDTVCWCVQTDLFCTVVLHTVVLCVGVPVLTYLFCTAVLHTVVLRVRVYRQIYSVQQCFTLWYCLLVCTNRSVLYSSALHCGTACGCVQADLSCTTVHTIVLSVLVYRKIFSVQQCFTLWSVCWCVQTDLFSTVVLCTVVLRVGV
jgi:hypothetical protein